MIGVGKDRSTWLVDLDESGSRPVPQDGTYDPELEFENIMGCHAGDFYGLNIPNPQPGYAYGWARYQRAGDQIRERQRGGVPVKYGDPDMAAVARMADGPTQLDDNVRFDDVQLMRYPESRKRLETDRRLAANHAQLRGAEAEYVSKASEQERQSGSSRIRDRRHRLEFRSGGEDGPLLDMYVPDDSVIEEG